MIRVASAFILGFLLVALAAEHPGIALYRTRNFAAAEQSFRRSLRIQPQNASLRLWLARTLVQRDRIPEALVELEAIQQAIPHGKAGSPEIELESGRLLRQLAERRFRDLQRSGTETAAVNEIAAKRLEREGNFPAALAQYREAQKLEPNRPGISYLIGSVLWKLRDFPAAEQNLRRELAQTPNHGMANFRLGQIELGDGRESEAATHLEAAAAALPDRLEIRRELGKAYRKTGKLQAAKAVWEEVARQRPQDDQVHFLLGGLYRELGETNLSQREFELHRQLLQQRRIRSERP